MINRIKRQEALRNSYLYHEIQMLQSVFYPDCLETAETEEELAQVKKLFDALAPAPTEPELSEYWIFRYSAQPTENYSKGLAASFTACMRKWKVEALYCLPHIKTSIYSQMRSRHPELTAWRKWLREICGSPAYDEAFLIPIDDLTEWMELLFWIGSCDGSAPEYIFISPTTGNFTVNICRYGNLHISAPLQKGNDALKQILLSEGMEEISRCG